MRRFQKTYANKVFSFHRTFYYMMTMRERRETRTRIKLSRYYLVSSVEYFLWFLRLDHFATYYAFSIVITHHRQKQKKLQVCKKCKNGIYIMPKLLYNETFYNKVAAIVLVYLYVDFDMFLIFSRNPVNNT